MKTRIVTVVGLAGVAIILLGRAFGFQQPPAPQPMIIDYIPMVPDLDKAERFYHQLLGLESAQGDPQARLAWYPMRPFLEDMYGVHGQLRNFYLRVPVTDMMIEPVQWSGATGKPLHPRLQDPGASLLILSVNNIDVLSDRLKKGGVKVVTTGGKPVSLMDETGMKRVIVFEDSNGFFTELVQREPSPQQTGDAPPTYFVNGSDITVTVADLDKSAKFYSQVLGIQAKKDTSFDGDAKVLDALGMKGAQYRQASLLFPDKTPQLHLVEFKGVDRKPLTPLIADPNSLVIRINVRDLRSIVAKVKTFSEAKIVNVSGGPTPYGRISFLMVRAPGGTHVQFLGPNEAP